MCVCACGGRDMGVYAGVGISETKRLMVFLNNHNIEWNLQANTLHHIALFEHKHIQIIFPELNS